MPFPLAHPAAVLPLKRLWPLRFDFVALMIGSLLPDMAYTIDDLNKFSRTVSYVFGPAAENLTWVKNAWDWDDFSHTFLGSVAFCLPLGQLLLVAFFSLRSAFVRTLPKPHRDALLPLCVGSRGSWPTCTYSLLAGIWTHIGWDSLTNGDRWLGQHWAFLRFPLEIGSTEIEVCHVLWLLSSLGGMVALVGAYVNFLRSQRSSGWLYQSGELSYYLLWIVVLLISGLTAIPLTLQFSTFAGTLDERMYFLHRFAGYYIAAAACGIVLVTLGSKLQECRRNAKAVRSNR